MTKKNINYSGYTMIGLHDADGTYTVRVLKRKTKTLGFTTLVSFNQSTANVDAIAEVMDTLDGGHFYSFKQNTGLTQAGKKRRSSRVDVNWATKPGQNFLNIVETCKPLGAGKLRDLELAKKVRNYADLRELIELSPEKFKSQGGSYPLEAPGIKIEENVINSLNQTSIEKVSDIAIAYLSYQNAESKKESTKKRQARQAKMKDKFNHVEPTQNELDLGIALGKFYTDQIEKIEQDHNLFLKNSGSTGFKIPEDYLIGMHIGDGSFGCEIRIVKKKPGKPGRNKYEIKPYMRVVQSNDCYSLLEAYITTFDQGRIENRSTSSRYRLVGAQPGREKIIPIFDKYFLPASKQAQYDYYKAIVDKVSKKDHLTYQGYTKIVDLVMGLSETTIGERGYTKEELLAKGKEYFEVD